MNARTSMIDCKTFKSELPDLILAPETRPSLAASAHMRVCPPCRNEYISYQDTFAALESWRTPEPSLYFDQKLAVRLREEQAAPRMSFLESIKTRLLFNTGRSFRPAMASVLGLVLVFGGGGLVSLNHTQSPPPPASAAINDLQILDHNEQAFQQMDELQQQDEDTQPNRGILNSDGTYSPAS